MYGWIWRHIPGHPIVRAIWALTTALFITWLLFEFVFPWLDEWLPWTDVTVDQNSSGVSGP